MDSYYGCCRNYEEKGKLSDAYISKLKEETGHSFDIVLVLERHTSELAMLILEAAERLHKKSTIKIEADRVLPNDEEAK